MTVASRIRNAPKQFHLSVRTESRGGQVDSSVADRDGLKRSGARHLLLLVHGFNNTEAEATASYEKFFKAMLEDLKKSPMAPDAVALFHWPGDIALSPWRFAALDALGYPKDITQAFESARSLASYLQTFLPPGPDARSLKLSLIGHSLGCRLILKMLNNVPATSRPEIVFVGLMAAAVGVGLAEPGTPYANLANPREKITKYTSTRDWVLQIAFPAGQAAAFATGIEKQLHREAVGRNGNPQSFGIDEKTTHKHDQYWPDGAIAKGVVRKIDASMAIPVRPAVIPANELASRSLLPPHRLGGRSLPS